MRIERMIPFEDAGVSNPRMYNILLDHPLHSVSLGAQFSGRRKGSCNIEDEPTYGSHEKRLEAPAKCIQERGEDSEDDGIEDNLFRRGQHIEAESNLVLIVSQSDVVGELRGHRDSGLSHTGVRQWR
jgi:hypothetical protein